MNNKKMKSRENLLIEKVERFNDWNNREQFFAFQKEMFALYDELAEEERYEVDESMVMEQIAMINSCYEKNLGGING